jgi:hypothetical protein
MAVKFTLVTGYPKMPAKVEIESNRGLSGSDVKELNAKLQETLTDCTGHEMCHDVISAVQQFLEANNVKPQSFYEAMLSREKRESDALKTLRSKEASSEGVKRVTVPPRPSAPNGDIPESGAINVAAQKDASLLDTASTLDFKQSTEFLSQQRLLSMASKRGKQPWAPSLGSEKSTLAGAAEPSKLGAGDVSIPAPTGIDNSDSLNISSLNASVASTLANSRLSGKSQTGASTKSWLKLFVNQTEGENSDEGSDSEDNNNPTGGAGSIGGTGAGAGALVPVIARAAPATVIDGHASRYAQEFHELSRLGAGASGQVWKVRNKLDRRIYAVKKIDLNAAENAAVGLAKIRREVTTISRLLHKHIVRYYAAWVEESPCNDACDDAESGDTPTASRTLGASSAGDTASSAASTPSRARPTQKQGGTADYLASVVGGGAGRYSAYGFNDPGLGEDYAQMYNRNPDDLWTFEDESESSAGAAGQPLSSPYAQQNAKSAQKGSRFYSYGGSSSDDDDSDSGSESDSDSGSESETDSDSSEEGKGHSTGLYSGVCVL